jgi:chromate transport protein ChrA
MYSIKIVLFYLLGHEIFEAIVDNRYIEPFLDGVGAAVIGLLILTCFQFVKSVIETGVDSVAFLLAFAALFHFTDKYTQPMVLITAAIA